jgi:hypothetical protein
MAKSRSLPATPANTGSRTRSSELKPRGPDQAISRRVGWSIPIQRSTGSSTRVRASSAMAANSSVAPSATVTPVQMSAAPKATKVKRRNISAVAWP